MRGGAGLQLCDVDFVAREIRVVGKGGHERIITLTDETWTTLERYSTAAV